MEDNARRSQRALFILLVGSIILVALVVRPLAIALFLAAVLAGALWPVHSRLTRLFRGRNKPAAAIVVFLVIALILGPIFGLSAFVVKEASEAIAFITQTVRSEGVEGLVESLPGPAERLVQGILDRVPETQAGSVQEQLTARGGQAAAALGSLVATTGSFVFQAVMMLIALFFFLTQKEALLRWVDQASPLRHGQTRELLVEFRKVTRAVVRSSILTAGVQALAALVGYFIARVPHPLFFASVTFFVALIPAVGAAVVVILSAGLMYLTGHPIAAIFLVIWGVTVVGLSDNIVKPMLIKGGVEMHGAVVFFSLLGGLAAFGAIGLLVGPLAVAFFVALLRIYRRDYGETKPPGGDTPPRRRPGIALPARPSEA